MGRPPRKIRPQQLHHHHHHHLRLAKIPKPHSERSGTMDPCSSNSSLSVRSASPRPVLLLYSVGASGGRRSRAGPREKATSRSRLPPRPQPLPCLRNGFGGSQVEGLGVLTWFPRQRCVGKLSFLLQVSPAAGVCLRCFSSGFFSLLSIKRWALESHDTGMRGETRSALVSRNPERVKLPFGYFGVTCRDPARARLWRLTPPILVLLVLV